MLIHSELGSGLRSLGRLASEKLTSWSFGGEETDGPFVHPPLRTAHAGDTVTDEQSVSCEIKNHDSNSDTTASHGVPHQPEDSIDALGVLAKQFGVATHDAGHFWSSFQDSLHGSGRAGWGFCRGRDKGEQPDPGSTHAPLFPPISYVADDAPITLSVAGTFRGGMRSGETPATPPAYDPDTHRLFNGSADRHAIDVLDIGDPSNPHRAPGFDHGIDLRYLYGTTDATRVLEPNSLAAHHGIIAAIPKGASFSARG